MNYSSEIDRDIVLPCCNIINKGRSRDNFFNVFNITVGYHATAEIIKKGSAAKSAGYRCVPQNTEKERKNKY